MCSQTIGKLNMGECTFEDREILLLFIFFTQSLLLKATIYQISVLWKAISGMPSLLLLAGAQVVTRCCEQLRGLRHN